MDILHLVKFNNNSCTARDRSSLFQVSCCVSCYSITTDYDYPCGYGLWIVDLRTVVWKFANSFEIGNNTLLFGIVEAIDVCNVEEIRLVL